MHVPPSATIVYELVALPEGPWSTPQEVPSPPDFPGDTNLAIIRRDGSLLGLRRPPWVWRAAHWKNVSSYTVQHASATIDGEDPFLYVDPRDPDVLHGLSHSGGWDSRWSPMECG